MPALPCTTNPRLYDEALDDDTPPGPRTQAIRQAAALCATCPASCELKITPDGPLNACCPEPSYATYLAHKKAGEDACEASKEERRVYDKARYAKNPRRARARQRAYEARQRAAKVLAGAA